jgi:hypothetical protein
MGYARNEGRVKSRIIVSALACLRIKRAWGMGIASLHPSYEDYCAASAFSSAGFNALSRFSGVIGPISL